MAVNGYDDLSAYGWSRALLEDARRHWLTGYSGSSLRLRKSYPLQKMRKSNMSAI